MADYLVSTDTATGGAQVWLSSLVGYCFYYRTNAPKGIYYTKTIDGGRTWGTPVQVNTEATAITVTGFAIWFDQWTPGDSGTLAHIVWADATETTLTAKAYFKLRSLDTSDDSFSSVVNIGNQANSQGKYSGGVSLTKAKGGNLYFHWNKTRVAGSAFYSSDDGGATWTSKTATASSSGTVGAKLLPGLESDTNDIYGFFHVGGDDITLAHYDASADSWSSTVLGTKAASFSAACVHSSNGRCFIVYALDNAVSGLDMKSIEVTGSLAYTLLADVFTGEANHGDGAAIGINSDGVLYVAYDGMVSDANGIGVKKSTDYGTSWNSEERYDTTPASSKSSLSLDARALSVYPIWSSSNYLYGNNKNMAIRNEIKGVHVGLGVM